MYCKEPANTITFALQFSDLGLPSMKPLLKLIILFAWLYFIAALWQSGQAAAAPPVAWSLPSPGVLSISRKVTDSRRTGHDLPAPPSVARPMPALLLAVPVAGH